MEELLNKLIKKWWKPRNKEEVKRLNYHTLYREVVSLKFDNYNLGVSYSIRDLVSKESGLWQFVCENMLFVIRTPLEEDYRWQHIECILNKPNRVYYKNDIDRWYDYQYRLIESALKDESELEKFLLDNIKV